MDNQVELLLARYPNKARSAAELAEWSVRNTIQCNMPLTVYNSLLDDIIEAVDHDEEPRLRDLLAHLCKPSDVDEASEEDGMLVSSYFKILAIYTSIYSISLCLLALVYMT